MFFFPPFIVLCSSARYLPFGQFASLFMLSLCFTGYISLRISANVLDEQDSLPLDSAVYIF
jgi:hypothetical protein